MSVIKTEHLIKTYKTGDTEFNALDDVSLNVDYGEMVAIMGSVRVGQINFYEYDRVSGQTHIGRILS